MLIVAFSGSFVSSSVAIAERFQTERSSAFRVIWILRYFHNSTLTMKLKVLRTLLGNSTYALGSFLYMLELQGDMILVVL